MADKYRTKLYDWTSAKVVDDELVIDKFQFCHDAQGTDVSAGVTGRINRQDVDPVVYPLADLKTICAELDDDDPRADEFADLQTSAKSAKKPSKKKAKKKADE